jgi:uncharacterized protein with PIN domain/sulfur carrier protein ThiS
MEQAEFRFYAELNDFLPPERRYRSFPHAFNNAQTVKHLIESLGVPHTEVDLVLVNGESADFSRRVEDGDRVSVYPVFEAFDIASVTRVRREPLREPRFVLDAHLGRLAAYLRMLGFDALYRNEYRDEDLARIASEQRRILLTNDRELLKRSEVSHGYCVRQAAPRRQLAEVLLRFDLARLIAPFTRCPSCNEPLAPAEKSAVEDHVPPRSRALHDAFHQCTGCGRVSWGGSHHRRMRRLIEQVLGDARA